MALKKITNNLSGNAPRFTLRSSVKGGNRWEKVKR
jgi:hypothetical protein